MNLLVGFVVAIGVTMALIPPLIRLAPRWRFVDVPQERKVHSQPIARVGGLAMAAGVLLAIVVGGQFASSNLALLAAMLIIIGFGAWDDRSNLSAGPKFFGQLLAAAVVIIFGDVSIASITLAERHVVPEWLALPLTFVFLVGATNAINLSDGLDGLAGGTILLCLSGIALLSFTLSNVQIGGLALVTIGAVLGFLRFNTHPARVFMGDTGSQLLGFICAVLAIQLTQDRDSPLSTALPLLLLGVPIIDTIMVMTRRIASGHSPFKADRTHIHHRLLALGFDHHEAVMTIYVAQSLLFVVAWAMRYESDVAIVTAFSVLTGCILGPLFWAQHRRWRIHRPADASSQSRMQLRAMLVWLAASHRLPRWCAAVIAIGLIAFAVVVVATSDGKSVDASYLSLAASAVLFVSLIVRHRAAEMPWIEKGAIYLCAVILVYCHQRAAQPNPWIWVIAGIVAIAVAIHMRLSSDRRFALTPLDLLVVLVALVVPNLPNSIASPSAVGAFVAQLVALFYGIEALSQIARRHWRWLSVGAMATLIAIGVIGM